MFYWDYLMQNLAQCVWDYDDGPSWTLCLCNESHTDHRLKSPHGRTYRTVLVAAGFSGNLRDRILRVEACPASPWTPPSFRPAPLRSDRVFFGCGECERALLSSASCPPHTRTAGQMKAGASRCVLMKNSINHFTAFNVNLMCVLLCWRNQPGFKEVLD